jgi:hypothetical protein
MRRRIAAGGIPLVIALAACSGSVPSGPSPQPAPAVLNPPTPPVPPQPRTDGPLAGTYTLDLTIDQLGSQCRGVPDAVRRRTYTATFMTTSDTSYTVSLTGGSFLNGLICTFAPSGLGCDQFRATHTGNGVQIDLINENDDGHGGHIVEQVPQAGWIELIGGLTGAQDNGTISAKGSGSLWYCSSSAGYPFPCVSYVGCMVDEMRMTFVRR